MYEKKTDRVNYLYNSRICPVCKKEFYTINDSWGYKKKWRDTTTYFCSWHCLRDQEKKDEAKKKNKKSEDLFYEDC